MRRVIVATICLFSVCLAPARGTPFFARTYHMACATCHSGFPRLNEFGLAFKANNFRVPGAEKSAILAWQKTVPLAVQVKPQIEHLHPGAVTVQFTETQILAGGLLSRGTAFYVHHDYFVDDKSQPFPSWEAWVQQVVDERHRIMLKAGQFELPYAYSPQVNLTTISLPNLFVTTAGQRNDVLLGDAMTGIQVSGDDLYRFHWYIAGGAPPSGQSGNRVGERQFFGRFRDVFLKASVGPVDKQAGAFAYFAQPPLTMNTDDSAKRFGLDGVYHWRRTQIQAMAVYGEDSNPANNGTRGFLHGALLEADRMVLPWLGVTARWDDAIVSTFNSRSYRDAKTLSLRVYPVPLLKLVAEYQRLDHGGSAELFMADIAF